MGLSPSPKRPDSAKKRARAAASAFHDRLACANVRGGTWVGGRVSSAVYRLPSAVPLSTQDSGLRVSDATTRFCSSCGAANPIALVSCLACRQPLPADGRFPRCAVGSGARPARAAPDRSAARWRWPPTAATGGTERATGPTCRARRRGRVRRADRQGGHYEPPAYVIRQQAFDEPAYGAPAEAPPPPARRGSAAGGCVMGLIAFAVICALTAVLVGLVIGRPILEDAVGEELGEVVATQIVRELDGTGSATPLAAGTYVIDAAEVNRELAADPDAYEPIENPVLTISPDGAGDQLRGLRVGEQLQGHGRGAAGSDRPDRRRGGGRGRADHLGRRGAGDRRAGAERLLRAQRPGDRVDRAGRRHPDGRRRPHRRRDPGRHPRRDRRGRADLSAGRTPTAARPTPTEPRASATRSQPRACWTCSRPRRPRPRAKRRRRKRRARPPAEGICRRVRAPPPRRVATVVGPCRPSATTPPRSQSWDRVQVLTSGVRG